MSLATLLAFFLIAVVLIYTTLRLIAFASRAFTLLDDNLSWQRKQLERLIAEKDQLWANTKGVVWVPPAPEEPAPVELPPEVEEAISAVEGLDAQDEFAAVARQYLAEHPTAPSELVVSHMFTD